jgi:deoxyribodipyrimidine photolyase-related protein
MDLRIILGNQLFPKHYYKNDKLVFMCEDIGLCTHFKYHKHKIIFFLASMRHYKDDLIQNKKTVEYFSLKDKIHFFDMLNIVIDKNKVTKLKIFEIEDHFFREKIQDFSKRKGIKLEIQKTPMFMITPKEFQEYLLTVKKPFMKNFYERNRRKFNILMDNDGKPVGGKFSYDTDNRKKIPKKFKVITNPIKNVTSKNIKDVIELVDMYFSDHPGSTSNFWLPVTREDSLVYLDRFIEEKFEYFGDYQDAIDQRDPFLYHSLLSPFINIGFITPEEILQKIVPLDVPMNAKEGFVRQVLGWREFLRGIYYEFDHIQQDRNFFNHKRKLTKDWYDGTTGIPPLDDAIKKCTEFGYAHHIERLMVLSNIMLMCEIDPKDVYKWFMEMFVDSSDWVMGPNVFGMGQFSDGGIFATKPYISGSNYIKKMSHYKEGDWCDILDGLYWMFIDNRKDFFKKQPRMNMMISLLSKMDEDKKKRIFTAAKQFINEKTV